MIIAEQKEKENIIEYILYIWQIEDIIRANNSDIIEIEKKIISEYNINDSKKEEVKKWYQSIISDLKLNNKIISGHSNLTTKIIDELNTLHETLKSNDKKYLEIYSWAKIPINEFKIKSKITSENEIFISLNALYAILLLKLKRNVLHSETEFAIKNISNLLGYLALKYKKLHI